MTDVECPVCGEQVQRPISPGDATKISRKAACGHWAVLEYENGELVTVRSARET